MSPVHDPRPRPTHTPGTTAAPLGGLRVAAVDADAAVSHAVRLLCLLGAVTTSPGQADVVLDATGQHHGARTPVVRTTAAHPAADWAFSGAMALTGRADGPPLPAPGAPASAVRGALLALTALLRLSGRPTAALPDVRLLGERAALSALGRRAPWSAGGSFRAVRAGDGWFGLSLARPADLDLLPALVEREVPDGRPWWAVRRWAASRPSALLEERALLLGLPAARIPAATAHDLGELPGNERRLALPTPFHLAPRGLAGRDGAPGRRPLVVNLSSLWAGPLCAHLLGLAGLDVVTVESSRRLDGARRGSPGFYRLLHAGHRSVVLDFADSADLDRLRALLGHADIVVEASRPRALDQLGVDRNALAGARPGAVWVQLTAYGAGGRSANRVGFGDDVAAGAGLVARDPATPGLLAPCGDALADPLTGVHAAVAAYGCLLGGGGMLVDIAMREVCVAALALGHDLGSDPHPPVEVRQPAAVPTPVRHADGWTPQAGADTTAVLSDLGLS